ncbi:TetR/AcrR family transcriptional regulator [Nitratiruptor sp. YY09-18]|uniref:TetR/AcrR family transcriptional regulator n=1 Tax=Nitratiruptor sp. YY09-18 TaxID=2724901 RepID=UPI0019166E0A|nr:TetR/AcrR family transcriptional regulator [Nitratiruptor sp. YY09-18]BCD67250.1 transcriptional regulator, TetR family [Nitratiruptor sp. YY09-18]
MSKREKLLQVAANHFSKFGYNGVSLDAIAKEVGISKAAIYYHFKDKDDLYEAVLLFRLDGLKEHIQSSINASSPVQKIKQFIESFGEFLQEYPCFAAILAHEFADNGKHMSHNAIKSLSEILSILTSILNEGIEKEEIEVQNPMVVQMMIVSPLIMHQTTQGLREKVTSNVEGFPVLPEPTIKDFSKTLAKKIIKAIRKEQ